MTKDAAGCLAGCLVVGAVAIALFAAFVARVRLYDSVGTYKGIANIGMAPVYLLALSLSLGILAWLVWRRNSK